MEPKKRILSIDILRGLVMVIMALDHVRDYFHQGMPDPMDLQNTSPILFFTRWITHYCAPVFVFLSGTSAYLSGLRKNKNQLSLFLLKRGAWLLLVEVTIVSFGWTFDPFFHVMVLQVIWAIGISMIFLALLCRLPLGAVLCISVTILCGHNLLDGLPVNREGFGGFLWDALHHGAFPMVRDSRFLVIYPVLPWIGLMALGYCTGRLYAPGFDAARRKRILLQAGAGMLLVFAVLRYFNLYGNPRYWEPQPTAFYNFLAMLKVEKYPPSLLYVCMTIGPALLLLAFSEGWRGRLASWLGIFGKVPFFYYILHIYTIHLLTVAVFFLSGYGIADISSPGSFFNFRPPGLGFSLGWVYVTWLLVVVFLYFPCRWFSRYKQTHSQWWLSYL